MGGSGPDQGDKSEKKERVSERLARQREEERRRREATADAEKKKWLEQRAAKGKPPLAPARPMQSQPASAPQKLAQPQLQGRPSSAPAARPPAMMAAPAAGKRLSLQEAHQLAGEITQLIDTEPTQREIARAIKSISDNFEQRIKVTKNPRDPEYKMFRMISAQIENAETLEELESIYHDDKKGLVQYVDEHEKSPVRDIQYRLNALRAYEEEHHFDQADARLMQGWIEFKSEISCFNLYENKHRAMAEALGEDLPGPSFAHPRPLKEREIGVDAARAQEERDREEFEMKRRDAVGKYPEGYAAGSPMARSAKGGGRKAALPEEHPSAPRSTKPRPPGGPGSP